MGFWYMVKSKAGTWHMCKPAGHAIDRRPLFPVRTECGQLLAEGDHLHEAPAFCRAGGERDRCRRCAI